MGSRSSRSEPVAGRPGGWRRRIAGAVAVVGSVAALVVVGVAGVGVAGAGAEEPEVVPRHPVTKVASAGWLLEGGTTVGLRIEEVVTGVPGANVATAFAFAAESRSCDVAADEWVFRSHRYEGPADPRRVRVAPLLASAAVDVRLPVRVVDERFADCSVEPTGVGGRVVEVGTFRTRVRVDWTATGPATPAGPDVVARPADARAVVSSDLLGVVPLPGGAGSLSTTAPAG